MTSVSTLENGLNTLEFSRTNFLGMLDDIPEDKLCHQPVAGGNHALWICGHLADADDFFLNALTGQDRALPESYAKLFGMGSQPTSDAAAYPSLTEIKAGLAERRQALIAWFKSLDDTTLASPLPGQLSGFAASHVALPGSLAWHEGLHTGQLTMIRKSLGIGPKFA